LSCRISIGNFSCVVDSVNGVQAILKEINDRPAHGFPASITIGAQAVALQKKGKN
jgi:hypothetical protein